MILARQGWRVLRRVAFAAAVTFAAGGTAALAQEGPPGPVEIIVGSGAGGTPDVLMRQVAQLLGEKGIVEQPIVVVNRTGGAWTVAHNYVLGKKGDKQTLLSVVQALITTPLVQKQGDLHEQVTPIAIFIQADLALLVQPNSPYNSLTDLIEASKANPRLVKFAGSQIGTNDHLVTTLLGSKAGVEFNYIPFDGGGAATAAFLGGNVDAVFATLDEALPLIESGKAKALAVTRAERSPADGLKDIPTAKEQGVDLVWDQFWGIAGPPEMDPALADWWDAKLRELTATEEWKSFAEKSFLRTQYFGRQDAAKFLADTHRSYSELMRSVGMAAQ